MALVSRKPAASYVVLLAPESVPVRIAVSGSSLTSEPLQVLSDGEVRKLLQTMNKGSSISDRQLECFKAACGTDNNGTMEISSGRLGAIDAALTDPEYPIALSKLLGPVRALQIMSSSGHES